MIEQIRALPAELGRVEDVLADSGYFSEANVAHCAAAQIDPMIAQGSAVALSALVGALCRSTPAPENPTPLEAMATVFRRPQARSSMLCASRSRNRCSGSSNR